MMRMQGSAPQTGHHGEIDWLMLRMNEPVRPGNGRRRRPWGWVGRRGGPSSNPGEQLMMMTSWRRMLRQLLATVRRLIAVENVIDGKRFSHDGLPDDYDPPWYSNSCRIDTT